MNLAECFDPSRVTAVMLNFLYFASQEDRKIAEQTVAGAFPQAIVEWFTDPIFPEHLVGDIRCDEVELSDEEYLQLSAELTRLMSRGLHVGVDMNAERERILSEWRTP